MQALDMFRGLHALNGELFEGKCTIDVLNTAE